MQHFAHRPVHADQRGARDDIVADIQFLDFRNARDQSHIPVSQAMSGQNFQALFSAVLGGLHDPGQFALNRGAGQIGAFGAGFRKGPRVELYHRGAQLDGGVDLLRDPDR